MSSKLSGETVDPAILSPASRHFAGDRPKHGARDFRLASVFGALPASGQSTLAKFTIADGCHVL